MSKKLALFLCLLLVLLLCGSLLWPGAFGTLTINGHVVEGPLGVAVGLWGTILTVVILFCVAILLVCPLGDFSGFFSRLLRYTTAVQSSTYTCTPAGGLCLSLVSEKSSALKVSWLCNNGGVGLVILGVFAFVGVILIAVSLPLLLPLMIPLFIVWLFCAMLRKGKGTEKGGI